MYKSRGHRIKGRKPPGQKIEDITASEPCAPVAVAVPRLLVPPPRGHTEDEKIEQN